MTNHLKGAWNFPTRVVTGVGRIAELADITRANGIRGNATLISLMGTANEIILDRSWLHGNPQDETSDGFAMSGGTSIAVIDSYFNDFHCISDVGSCTDAHSVTAPG